MNKEEQLQEAAEKFVEGNFTNYAFGQALIGVLKDFAKSEAAKDYWQGYWKERCLLAEDCLEKTPCDPDTTPEQIEAHKKYHSFFKNHLLKQITNDKT